MTKKKDPRGRPTEVVIPDGEMGIPEEFPGYKMPPRVTDNAQFLAREALVHKVLKRAKVPYTRLTARVLWKVSMKMTK